MKITLVGPVYPYRGGIAHYTAYLAQALASSNHQVRVSSFRRQYPGWLYPGQSDKDPSAHPLQVEAEYLLDPLYPWTWWQAWRGIQKTAPDLVLIQWWTTFWAPAFASLTGLLRRSGVPVAFVIHNVLPHEARFWDTWLAGLVLRQGKAFIVQTPREQVRLDRLVSGAVVKLCPMPSHARFSARVTSRAEARSQLGLPLDAPVLLFFGIVRPYKGLDILLEALAYLRACGQQATLVVAGEFWEGKSAYLKQIEDLELTDLVRIEDRYISNEEADLWFSAADALVAPYLAGTQSGVAGLALGYGLPLVVSDKVAAGIAAQHQNRLRVVPSGDDRALSEAIQNLLEDAGSVSIPPAPVENDWGQLVTAIEELGQSMRLKL